MKGWDKQALVANMTARITDAANEEIDRGRKKPDQDATPSFSSFGFWVREYLIVMEPLRSCWRQADALLNRARDDMIIQQRQQSRPQDKTEIERDSIKSTKLQIIALLRNTIGA